MARIELTPEIIEDLDRIIEHLLEHQVESPQERIEAITSAIDLLESSPLIGRICHRELRELVIGRSSKGYVALYQYVEAIDVVFVLAIRSQGEAGYAREADDLGWS
ncbi:MAG: type II toxin-antitoxin system RelE/ParE family toxin [Oceanococcus sp.]